MPVPPIVIPPVKLFVELMVKVPESFWSVAAPITAAINAVGCIEVIVDGEDTGTAKRTALKLATLTFWFTFTVSRPLLDGFR